MSEEGRKLSADEKEALMRGDLEAAGMEKEPPKEEVVEKTEDVKEEKTEEKTEEKAEEKVEEVAFDFSALGKKFEREINDEESLKSLFEKADKYESTTKDFEETKQKLTDYQKRIEKINPLAHFKNEDEYKRQQLLIKKGDDLGVDAMKELSVLNPSKVSELSDVAALKLQLMVDKSVTAEEADAYLQRKYDVTDFMDEDIEAGVKSAIKIDAIDARRQVSDLYSDIDIPEQKDFETSRQELQSAWDTPLQELKKGINELKITEDVGIALTESMLGSIDIDGTLKELVANGVEPSEAALGAIAGEWRKELLSNNIEHVLKAATNKAVEQNDEKWRAKIHNDKPLDNGSREESKTDEDNDSKMSRIL